MLLHGNAVRIHDQDAPASDAGAYQIIAHPTIIGTLCDEGEGGCSVEVSVREAAQRLSVSPQRIRALAGGGRIPARKLGRDWAIDLDQIGRQDVGRPGRGRPLSARSCWAILDMLAQKKPEGLSRSERLRARARLESLADSAPGDLSARAEVFRYVIHRGLIERVATDPRIVLGGVSAASNYRADLVALEEIEGYVRAEDLERLIGDHALLLPSVGVRVNVLLRVPVPRWPFEEGERIASRGVVAVDLIDAGDDRSVRAGRKLLADLR